MLRLLTFCVFCLIVGALGFSLWLGTVAVLLWPWSTRRGAKQVQQRLVRFPLGEQVETSNSL
jgi:hypothetical protein